VYERVKTRVTFREQVVPDKPLRIERLVMPRLGPDHDSGFPEEGILLGQGQVLGMNHPEAE